MSYRVRVFRTGHMKGLPGPEVYWMAAWDQKFPADFLSCIIEGNGHTVLVNTGCPRDMLPEMNQNWRNFYGEDTVMHIAEEEWMPEALSRFGLTPEQITHVVVTPFQNYATGNLDKFPNATICLSRKGWQEFIVPRWRPHPHDIPRYCFPPKVLAYLVTEAWDRVRLLEEEDEIVPGVTTFWTGVHHRSSIAIKVQTSKGNVIISDAFFSFGNIEKRHPIGICENIYEALEAYDRIRREGNFLVPLYDPEVFVRYPGGVVA